MMRIDQLLQDDQQLLQDGQPLKGGQLLSGSLFCSNYESTYYEGFVSYSVYKWNSLWFLLFMQNGYIYNIKQKESHTMTTKNDNKKKTTDSSSKLFTSILNLRPRCSFFCDFLHKQKNFH